MPRTITLDPSILCHLQLPQADLPDPDIVEAVTAAIDRLPPDLQDVIRCRFFEGLSIPQIASRRLECEKATLRLLYRARQKLKLLLSDFVEKRWGLLTRGLCRICIHPKRTIIESILRAKNSRQSWGRLCEKVEEATAERFHPPQILKAHLDHMDMEPKRKHRSRKLTARLYPIERIS